MTLGADSTQTYYLRLTNPQLVPTPAQLDEPSRADRPLQQGTATSPIANPGDTFPPSCRRSAYDELPVFRGGQSRRRARLRLDLCGLRRPAGAVPFRRPLLKSPTASTKVVGVIGDPVEHSLSPVLHNAAFEALNLDWVYVAFHVASGQRR